MSVTESPTFWDKTSRFVATHKSAIVITAAVGASAAAGAYYYMSNGSASGPISDSTSSKKKKKSKKKKATNKEEADHANLKELLASAIFPFDAETLSPKVDETSVTQLTADEKEQYAAALKETGNALFKEKSYLKAIEYYSAALKCKEDPVFYSNRSACYSYLEDHEKVVEDTTAAIKLKPDYIKCLLRRSQSYDVLERYEDAMFDLTAVTLYGGVNTKTTDAQLEKILQKHATNIVDVKLMEHKPSLPTTSSISPFLGAFTAETSIEGVDEEDLPADSPAKFLIEALKELSSNTTEGYEKADVLLKQSTDRYGKDLTSSSPTAKEAAIAFEYLGAFDFLKNNTDMAINNLLYAINLNPRPRAYVVLALVYADRQEFESSAKQFDAARALDPNNADVHYHLGQLLYLSNSLAEASEHFEKAKELNPDNVYPYIQLACIAYREGKVDEADQKFAEARKKFPLLPEIPNYYGEILSDKQDFDGAIKQFDIAARLQAALPNFSIGALALVNKATLVSRTDILKADEILTEAIKLDPKSEVARMALGQVKLQLEQPQEAVRLFEAASDLSRVYAEKLQATQFAEAAKMQVRLRQDPALSQKVQEIMARAAAFQ